KRPYQTAGQAFRALLTAEMISVMVTGPPFGTPCGQAAAVAFPRATFTREMISLTATLWAPLQSPAQAAGGAVGEGVGVGRGGGDVGVAPGTSPNSKSMAV